MCGGPTVLYPEPFRTAGGAGRVSVAKVQVGLLGSARVLQRDLERIAKRADTNSSEGLTFVLQGVAPLPSTLTGNEKHRSFLYTMLSVVEWSEQKGGVFGLRW